MPLVSVIITTHDRPNLLPRAIDSARSAGTNVEIVVIDDASIDDTATVCRRFSNIRYVRVERNQKVAGARNLGILASSGDYISFLDDDDVRLPQSLDIQVDTLEAEPEAGFVYGQVIIGDQSGETGGSFYPDGCPQGNIFWELLQRNFIPCGAVVFRKSCLYRVGLLDESIPGIDDWDLWIRIAEIYGVLAIEKPVAIWRRPTPTSGQGGSRTVDLISLSSRLMRQRWLKLPCAANGPRHQRRDVWREFSMNVSEHLVWEAASALAGGDLEGAGKAALTALRLHPAGLLGVGRRWIRFSTFWPLLASRFINDGPADTKAHFKRMRCSGR